MTDELMAHLNQAVKEHNLCECFVSRFRVQILDGTIKTREDLQERIQPWINAKIAGMM